MSRVEQRVDQLLRSMTWDEKLAQMQIVFGPDPADLERWVRAGVGAIFWPCSAAAVNGLQRVAVEQTRLGIPLLVGLDVIHGQRTIAPTPLAMAASFDPDVVERTARLAAAEAASGGVNWTFSPMIDVSRDPRWGRAVESFGEDPHLNAVMGAAMIRGYQDGDLREPGSIAATAKHFVGYGHAEGGRDYNTADMSEHLLRNVYLEPFRAATAAGVAAVTGGAMRQEAVDIGLAGPDNVTEKYTSNYLDLELGPQFDFGHGGGYTFTLYIGGSLHSTQELTFEVV